jgi:tetratricopeptide (TPR) repeat protein
LETGLDYVLNDSDLRAEFQAQIGEAQFGLNHLKEALAAYESARSLAPQNTFVKNKYAYRLALHELDLLKAEKIIDEVLLTFPNEPSYLETKGFILFQEGKYTEAKSFFERACGGAETKDKSCAEHLGDVLFMLGKKDEAMSYWLRAKELGSTNKVLNEKITQKKYAKPVF